MPYLLHVTVEPIHDILESDDILRAFNISWSFLKGDDTNIEGAIPWFDQKWITYRCPQEWFDNTGHAEIGVCTHTVQTVDVNTGPVFFHAHRLYHEFILCGITLNGLRVGFPNEKMCDTVIRFIMARQEPWHELYHSHLEYCTDEEKAKIEKKGQGRPQIH